jgi:C_GCAxxG_C_C family probable redox protein
MNAIEYFNNGFSCSESLIKWAIDEGLVSDDLLPVATSFSGGMGVRCLCGAVAGAEMVIGAMYGRSATSDGKLARKLAKEFFEKFAEKYKVACCKVLSAKYEFASPERKQHCSLMVYDICEILEKILEENKVVKAN